MPGLPFPALGQYRFVIRIDQTQESELPFRVARQLSMTGVAAVTHSPSWDRTAVAGGCRVSD